MKTVLYLYYIDAIAIFYVNEVDIIIKTNKRFNHGDYYMQRKGRVYRLVMDTQLSPSDHLKEFF